jgi:hypothetical protein
MDSPHPSTEPSTSRLDTATSGTTTSPRSDRFPAEIFRPRNRPRKEQRTLRNQPSAETVASQRTESSWTDRIRRPTWSSSAWGSGIFSPHLHRDRRGDHGLNAWSPPSLDEQTRRPFGPAGRQVLLFCLGFVFPLGELVPWLIRAEPQLTF